MSKDKIKHTLQADLDRWAAAMNNGGYSNTWQPSPNFSQSLAGFSAIFSMLAKVRDCRPAVIRILTLGAKVDIARYEERVDVEHWKVIRDEILEMARWYAEYKDKTYLNEDERRPYDEREAYLTHMLNAFANGERFIVAKLSYDGGTQ
ncbi:hypothetical protein [Rhizobium sp.]|uniref:hypothetical protein n=1 Tax=Rhizobium sp. TaxID=391 RepID=UPI0034C5F327